ncbi:hypothetical protein [Nonlabens dokdonensis]|uniref:Uncharacterized protein n=1 Tax=Nonlabens dokdonensis (strain DSM 17205 / KCTC 12402 / DSW-6) TaxID=592029 RepID=L7WAG0_NONDD|nr:hypothetical protein [Nonlabens dokdonensis]AGC76821.1 hypothetical protein DDD_1694 [Nonlabens dokdonensis DSW-6]
MIKITGTCKRDDEVLAFAKAEHLPTYKNYNRLLLINSFGTFFVYNYANFAKASLPLL